MTDGFSLAALKTYVINALAAAALVAGGATVVQGKVDNARQDEQLNQTERALQAIPEIQKDVRETRIMVERMDAQNDRPRN